MKKTEQKILKFIDENSLISKGDKIIVAFSGGPDSVFLLYFLKKFQNRLNVSLAAFHLNHMLRGTDAVLDECFCENMCSELNIPFYSVRKNVKQYAQKNKISVEEAGRKIRYAELDKIIKSTGFNKIATAHHLNDNAETVLFNLIKGTGLKGISGIPVVRNNIIRPVLNVSKEEILIYLEEENLVFRIDKSNEVLDYERNFIRHELIPLIKQRLNPSVENALFNSSRNFRNIYSYLLNKTKQELEDLIPDKNGLRIPLDRLRNFDDELLTFALKELTSRNFSVNLTFNNINSLKNLIVKDTGVKLKISDDLIVYKERKDLIFFRNGDCSEQISVFEELAIGEEKAVGDLIITTKPVENDKISPGKEKTREFISADNIFGDKFIIRTWQEGDRFIPFGMKGSKLVSDFLNEIKIESHKKKEQLLLVNGKKIVWVIGHRIDDRFRIRKDTQKVLELCMKIKPKKK
jgi:tRNA(Ile)-lysidine synthase